MGVAKESFIQYAKEKYTAENIVVDIDNAFVEPIDENIRAEDFPDFLNVYAGKSYPKPVYYFYLPFSGKKDLLFMQASTYTYNPRRASVQSEFLVYRYVQYDDDMEKVNNE
ncbi:hypothetical protein ACIQZI_12685 [Peribacillus sp. NPDC096379]|uniref:hypothetical protein n=1 Tax=Peribacillus sp. NPDC096379 TaxID=3364393 RepID=UPI0038047621